MLGVHRRCDYIFQCLRGTCSESGKYIMGLDEVKPQLHPGKCVFAQPQVQYVGFVLSERGVSASPDK
jgi:hypothetical protein